MSPTKTCLLFGRYPRLYQDMREPQMSPHYFSCGDGWFHLIDQLSADIEVLCDKLRSEEGLPDSAFPVACQVGKSSGQLRFRVRTKDGDWGFCRVGDMIDSLIEVAVDESRYTCDLCGRCYRPDADRTGREWRSPCAQCHGRAARTITAPSPDA
jgi:hypothetical protein